MAVTRSADELFQSAQAALRQGDLKSAVSQLESVIEADPRHIDAHELLAKLAFRMKDYDRAAELFQRVTRLDPRNSAALVNLGAVYNRMAKYKEAVATLRRALSKDRRCAEAYYNLGIAERGHGQLALAVSAYKEAIRLAPEMPEAYQNLGNVLMEQGNHTQAILNFERALSLRPNFDKARRGLERARATAEDAKRSISPFGRLVDVNTIARHDDEGPESRELTPTERYDDRTDVHRLSKESERLAAALLKQLREELASSLLAMGRLATDRNDPIGWARESHAFHDALGRFHQLAKMLEQKTDELRSHERFIRRSS